MSFRRSFLAFVMTIVCTTFLGSCRSPADADANFPDIPTQATNIKREMWRSGSATVNQADFDLNVKYKSTFALAYYRKQMIKNGWSECRDEPKWIEFIDGSGVEPFSITRMVAYFQSDSEKRLMLLSLSYLRPAPVSVQPLLHDRVEVQHVTAAIYQLNRHTFPEMLDWVDCLHKPLAPI